MLSVTIPGEPVAQGRPRAFKTPRGLVRAYDPPKSRAWKGVAQVHMQEALREAGQAAPLVDEGPVEVLVVAVFSCPKGDYLKRVPRPRRPHAKRPDAENVAKAILDAGTGLLWRDDSQVADLRVVKVIGAQGEAPRVEVDVDAALIGEFGRRRRAGVDAA